MKLTYARSINDDIIWETSVYGGLAGGDYFSGFRDSIGTLMQINYPLKNRHSGVMSMLAVNNLARGLNTTIGAHAYMFRRRNWEFVSPASDAPYYDDSTRKNELSGFVRADYAVGALTLRADLQVRYVDMTFSPDRRLGITEPLPVHSWLFVNPRLGVTYDLDDASEFYASYGRTSREPTRFDLLGSTQVSAANVNVLRNPNTVLPEVVDNVELGYRYLLGDVRFSANAFGMFMTDEIAPIGAFIEQQFVQLRKNVPSSRRLGLELEAAARVLPSVDVSASATAMTATITEYRPDNLGRDTVFTNVEPILTPNLMARLSATWHLNSELSITGDTRYVSRSFVDLTNDPTMVLPSFVRLDMQVRYRIKDYSEVVASINNLTDAFIVTNGGSGALNGVAVPTYFVQAGRNIMVSFRWKF